MASIRSSEEQSNDDTIKPFYKDWVELENVRENVLPQYSSYPPRSRQQDMTGPVTLHVTDAEVLKVDDCKGSRKHIFSNTLARDPDMLEKAIRNQLWQPPRVYILIKGSHPIREFKESSSSSEHSFKKVTDFEIKLDISELHGTYPLRTQRDSDEHSSQEAYSSLKQWSFLKMIPEGSEVSRGGVMKSSKNPNRTRYDIERVDDSEEYAPDLAEWARRFCASYSIMKTFEIQHEITDRDDHLLKAKIHQYIRATNYHGNISMVLITHSHSRVYERRNILNVMYHNKWVRRICCLLQLWIIIWPVLILMTRRWAVVKIVWPTRRDILPMDAKHPLQASTRQLLHYRAKSELAWAEQWRYSIQKAVLAQQKESQVVQWAGNGAGDARTIGCIDKWGNMHLLAKQQEDQAGNGAEEARRKAEEEEIRAILRRAEAYGDLAGGTIGYAENVEAERGLALGWGWGRDGTWSSCERGDFL